jgi:hypothetical protein
MTDTADIVADFRRVAVDLADPENDPAAARVADAITRWLAGEDFDSAAGLAPGWRQHVQKASRDAALSALLALHTDMDDQPLARRIAAGVERAARMRGIRPDREDGHFHDLARAQVHLSARHWRRLIGEARGQPDDAMATSTVHCRQNRRPS